jgi:DNA-binding beta-propeller fold protein YncE
VRSDGPSVSVYDELGGALLSSIAIPDGGTRANDVAIDVTHEHAYVVSGPSFSSDGQHCTGSHLSVIDMQTFSILAQAALPDCDVFGVAVDPATRMVYATNYDSNTVSVFSDDVGGSDPSPTPSHSPAEPGSLLSNVYALPTTFTPGSQRTNLHFTLSEPANVSVTVVGLRNGNLVRSWADKGFDAGDSHIVWNGRNYRRRYVRSGAYRMHLYAEDTSRNVVDDSHSVTVHVSR